VRFDVKLLQQLSALYPHVEIFAAGQPDREPESSAAIIGGAKNLDFHLARDRGDFAIGADREVIERAQRRSVLIVKSHATRHLKISFFHLLSALARCALADVLAALDRGGAGLHSALHGLSLEVAAARDGLPFDRLVIANQLIRGQQTTIIFRHLGFSLMSRWQARIGDLD
jgi:hypothetical protein